MWGGEEGRRSPTLALYNSQQQAACRGQWKCGYGAIGLLAVRQLLWMSLVAPHSEKVNRRRHGRCCREEERLKSSWFCLLLYLVVWTPRTNSVHLLFSFWWHYANQQPPLNDATAPSCDWESENPAQLYMFGWHGQPAQLNSAINSWNATNLNANRYWIWRLWEHLWMNEWKNGIGGFQKNFIYSTTGATRWTLSGWILKSSLAGSILTTDFICIPSPLAK